MSEEPMVECSVHGRRAMAVACTHIAHGLLDRWTPGFVVAPDNGRPDDFAWCDDCETMVVSLGGDWTPEASAAADFKLICADCYLEGRGLAVVAGRFRNLRRQSG